MRLNGKARICEYLGYDPLNWAAWQQIKLRYGRVIWIRDHGGHRVRYWTQSEWLDAVDTTHGRTVYDIEYDKLVERYQAGQGLLEIAKKERIREKQLAVI